MVRIRRYEPGDGPAIRRLNERALRAVGTDPADVPGSEDLHSIEASYLDAGGEFLVAELEEALVGMGGLQIDGPTGELFRMRVDPDHQREGVGAAILDGLEGAARERGVEVLEAETAVRQTAATAFYPANGYVEVGRRSVGEYDLIRYEKEL